MSHSYPVSQWATPELTEFVEANAHLSWNKIFAAWVAQYPDRPRPPNGEKLRLYYRPYVSAAEANKSGRVKSGTQRRCLCCSAMFPSVGIGNRICDRCKSTVDF